VSFSHLSPSLLRRLAQAAVLAAALAGGSALSAQPGAQPMQQAVDALTRALQQKDFAILSPYLDATYQAPNVPPAMARQLLQQVVASGARVPSAVQVESVTPEGDHVRVAARFDFPDGSRSIGLLLTQGGRFVEVPLFRVSLAPGMTPQDAAGAMQGGLRVRTGEPPPQGGVRVAPPPPPPAAGAAPAQPALRQELLQMQARDQQHRAGDDASDEGMRAQAALDSANVRRLEEIIARHGWPGRSLVGQDGSVAAFLVLQHADEATQERHLPLVRAAAQAGELLPSMAAMLEDRVRMRRGEKQLYGTQLRTEAGSSQPTLWPVEDEANVDARRAAVGLPPLATYLRGFGIEYRPPTP
jgi:hypothetical protein